VCGCTNPYYAWDNVEQHCTAVGSPDWSAGRKRFIQSIALGEHKACGRVTTEEVAPAVSSQQTTKENGSKLPSSQEKLPIYTAETLSIAVATSCPAALVVGFVSGFLFSRRCRTLTNVTNSTD
jgi:semaphorin 6